MSEIDAKAAESVKKSSSKSSVSDELKKKVKEKGEDSAGEVKKHRSSRSSSTSEPKEDSTASGSEKKERSSKSRSDKSPSEKPQPPPEQQDQQESEDEETIPGPPRATTATRTSSPTETERRCPSHPTQFLRYYCETCDAPMCSDCRVFGPHDGQFHRVVSLTDAFRGRLTMIHSAMNGPLMAKKDALLQQALRIEGRMQEVRLTKVSIEQETRAEMEAILQRLNSEEAWKGAQLQQDITDIRRDLDEIGRFTRRVTELSATSDPTSMFEFLARHREFSATCDALCHKPFKMAIEVRADDLEREMLQRKQAADECGSLSQLLKLKDSMIWHLLEQCAAKDAEIKRLKQTNASTQEELTEWMHLSDQYAEKLRSLTE